ncbi:hypothetical protein Tco_1272457 [Tanacetum coccineum]
MRTRSQSRNLHHQQQQAPPPVVEPFNLEEPIENPAPPLAPMDDTRTMAQLLEAPTAGYEDAIVVPEITADNFELKHELHQLDTFYNALNSNDQDSLNSAAGGNFLDKMPRDCLRIIESKSKVRNSRNKPVVAKVSSSTSTPGISSDVAELKDMVKEYVSQAAAANYNQGNTSYRAPIANQIRPPSFPPVQNNQNNQGNNQNRYNQNRGNFNQASAYQPPVHQGQIYRPQVVQPPAYQAPAPQIQGVSKEDFQAYVKANDAVMRNMQTQGITTRSGVAYKGPTIPTISSPKVVERETEVTKDTMPPTNNGSIEDVQPPVVPVVHHESISEPVNAPVSASMPNQKPSIPFPSIRNDERRHEKANDQIEKFYEIFRDLSLEISFTDALMLMLKFASTLKTLIGNKEKLSEMARTPLNENCSAVILNKLPKKLRDLGRFLIPCEFYGINTCNALPISARALIFCHISYGKISLFPN